MTFLMKLLAFTKYSVEGDERADQVAYDFYKDSGLRLGYFDNKQHCSCQR